MINIYPNVPYGYPGPGNFASSSNYPGMTTNTYGGSAPFWGTGSSTTGNTGNQDFSWMAMLMGLFTSTQNSGSNTNDETEDTQSTTTASPSVSSPAVAIQRLLASSSKISKTDGDDSSLSLQDLATVAENDNNKFSKKSQAAAQYMLDNPDLWQKIDASDGNADNKTNAEALQNALGNPDITQSTDSSSDDEHKVQASDGPLDLSGQDAAKALQDHWDDLKNFSSDGDPNSIDQNDLQAVVNDEQGTFDKKTREAARFFLQNQGEFNQLETETNSKSDGLVSQDDLAAYLKQNTGNITGSKTASQALLKQWNTITSLDGKGDTLSATDLLDVLQDSDNQFDAKTKEAARFFLKNPDAFKQMESTQGTTKADGLASHYDLEQTVNTSPTIQTRDALQSIKNQWNDIPGLSGDKNYVDTDDLTLVVNDTSGKFSQKTKDAAQYLLGHLDQLNAVANSDSSQSTPDGNFSWQDMDQFAKNSGAPLD